VDFADSMILSDLCNRWPLCTHAGVQLVRTNIDTYTQNARNLSSVVGTKM